MKYARLLLLIAAIALLSAAVSMASPVMGKLLNFPNVNPNGFTQFTPFLMRQGWENNQLTWFIATDSSDQQIACETQGSIEKTLWGINFSPALANLTGQVPLVYVITNLNQGPVFTAVPGDPTYSGIWQVVFVTFNTGVTKHIVTNADAFDPMTNPNGLPSMTDATYRLLNHAGEPIVVKYPIVAIGQLGGPWTPSIPGEYRIPQGKVMTDYTRTKTVWLPFWQIYCRNPITKRVHVQAIVVPDAFDPPGLPFADQLVPKLGANPSPGLGLINQMFTQPFYQQLGPQPLNQFPILHACPEFEYRPCQNFNFDYIPLETVVVLQRNFPMLPASTVITNEPTLLLLEGKGLLTPVRSSQIINGSVITEVECQ